MRDAIRRNVWVLLVGILLVVALTSSVTQLGPLRAAIDDQDERAARATVGLDRVERERRERSEADVAEALGVSGDRVIRDTRIIRALCGTAFTWDTGLAYEAAREEVKERYGFTEDDTFMTDVMAPSRYNEDSEGHRVWYIDTVGINSALDDVDVDVAGVMADRYDYVVVAHVDATSDAVDQRDSPTSDVTASRDVLLALSIDGDGRVSNLNGWTASGDPIVAG